jgi:hypothetical protein
MFKKAISSGGAVKVFAMKWWPIELGIVRYLNCGFNGVAMEAFLSHGGNLLSFDALVRRHGSESAFG